MFNLKRAISVWQRNFTVYRKLYKSSMVLNFVEPLLYLTAFGIGLSTYLKEINGIPYIKFIAPGIVASSSAFAATYECTYGTYVRMHYQKTFDAILATPVNLNDLIAGEILWGATKSLIYGTIIISVISIAGLVDSWTIILAIPLIFLSGLLFSEISVITSATVPGIDSFNYFYTLFMTPLFLFSGIFFPLEGLPEIIKKISFLNPLYHMVEIMRAFSSGNMSRSLPHISWILIINILLISLPFRLMKRRLIK
ncbi:MAG: ABC transporter permease [Thermodesulfovibrionales bacterium]|nr:ABC transporter permease [Thermodesulfovibrionales bacterium]